MGIIVMADERGTGVPPYMPQCRFRRHCEGYRLKNHLLRIFVTNITIIGIAKHAFAIFN